MTNIQIKDLRELRKQDQTKQNKIYKHYKYNLLMKKLSQTYFKQVQTKPIRLQSPDRKSSNSIRPTLSPQNIEYILKQNDRHTTTPTKSSQETPIKNEARTISNSRYFNGNKSSNIKKSYLKTEEDEHYPSHHLPTSIANSNNRSYTHQDRCQNCVGNCRCVHAVANEEVVVELRRIITMINGAQSVSGFYAGDQDVAKTVEVLKSENQRLSDLLDKYKSRIQSRIDPIPNNYQSQVRILRQQLSHNITQHQKQRQQLYRTNKALSSQLKSMQSKLTSTQAQLQSLRSQVRASSSTILQQNKKSTDKLSLSMIKDQYNSSLKTLQTNIQFDIDNKMNDYQSDLKEYKLRIDILEDRLKGFEKLDYLNQRLNEENKRMKKWIQDRDRESLQERGDRDDEMDKLIKDNYELEEQVKMLRNMVAEKSAYEKVIGELREGKGVLQRKLEETDKKVKELMQNYQKQIKILKSKPVQKQSDQTQNLRIQNQQYWQQILKLRNELARYTSQNSKLQSELSTYKQQMNKLNHKYNNEHINLVAKTTLLDNQNQRLRKQLDNTHIRGHAVPDLQHALTQLQQDNDGLLRDNQKLRQDVGRMGHENDGLSEQIRVLREENDRIHQENQRINNQIRLASSRFNDVQNGRENERQELLRQIDKARNEIQNLNIEIDRLKNDHKKKQMQLRQSLKQQLDQTKSLYQQQLSQCQSQYTSLSNTHTSVLQQLQSIKQSQSLHHKSSQQTLAQKDQKIYEHELTISNLSKILEETEQKIIKLQQYRQERDRQINRLTYELDKLKEKYQNNIKDNDLYWGKQVDGLKAEIGTLRAELEDRDRREREEVERVSMVRTRVAKLKSQGLRRELEELKRLVEEASLDKIQQQLTRISENYEHELVKSQQKSQQIDNLLKQKFQLEEKVSNLQHIRIGLQQRISTLQSSNKLLQQLQQQQKQSLNKLLFQKQALEKQNMALKRVKLDKESIEATKSKARQISMKIDKLLALEQRRQNDYMEISNTYTDAMSESVIIRRI